MSETKWTPGPWAACSRQGDDWDSVVYLPRDSNLEICQCFHGKWTAGKDRCEANARLIAAAPELYEALELEHQAFKDLYREALEEKPDPIKVIDIANRILSSASGRPVDTALAKARGEA